MITEIEQFEFTITKSIESGNKEIQSTYGYFFKLMLYEKNCYTGMTKFVTV